VTVKYVVIAITPALVAVALARLAQTDRPYLRLRGWRPALTGIEVAVFTDWSGMHVES
jgi:hypothetical protein